MREQHCTPTMAPLVFGVYCCCRSIITSTPIDLAGWLEWRLSRHFQHYRIELSLLSFCAYSTLRNGNCLIIMYSQLRLQLKISPNLGNMVVQYTNMMTMIDGIIRGVFSLRIACEMLAFDHSFPIHNWNNSSESIGAVVNNISINETPLAYTLD